MKPKTKSLLKNGKTMKPVIKTHAVTSPKKCEVGSSSGNNKKKQTKQKSPTKKSGYLIFSIKKRKEIIDQEPYKSMKQPDVFKAIGQMWKDLSTEEKNIFNEEAKKENEKIVEAKTINEGEEEAVAKAKEEGKANEGEKEESKEEEEGETKGETNEVKEKGSPSAQ